MGERTSDGVLSEDGPGPTTPPGGDNPGDPAGVIDGDGVETEEGGMVGAGADAGVKPPPEGDGTGTWLAGESEGEGDC